MALFCVTILRTQTLFFFFFFNDTATTEIYTLSLHDALPISQSSSFVWAEITPRPPRRWRRRSEEHTSELQSQSNLVCRLLLEKKKTIKNIIHSSALQQIYTDNVTVSII